MKNVIGVLFILCTVFFWMGCEKDAVDDPNPNNNSGDAPLLEDIDTIQT